METTTRWYLIPDNAVAKVEGGQITGLMIYGEVTGTTLRNVSLRKLRHIDEEYGTWWNQECPPTALEVHEAAHPVYLSFASYRPLKNASGEETGEEWTARRRRFRIEEIDELIREHVMVIPDEPVNAYYVRFAAVVRAIAPHVESVNQRIASASGLTRKTVEQYVFRCRKLGYLAPSGRTRT